MNEQTTTQISPQAPKQNYSKIIIGVLIAIIVILVAVGFYISKNGNSKVETGTTEKITQPENPAITTNQTESAGIAENQAAQSSQTVTEVSQTPVDFSYELKQLDTQVNSVNSADLNESEMSDIKAGL
jgi:uncharacterized protein HemX